MAKSVPPCTRGLSRVLPNQPRFCQIGREGAACPGSAYFVTWRLDGSLPGTRRTDFWTRDGPRFVELEQRLDAVSTGPRCLERLDVAGVVANTLRKGVRESRYELGPSPPGRSGSRFYGREH